ncbi:MAG: aldose 1-epimerase [Thermoleophilia bacterium]
MSAQVQRVQLAGHAAVRLVSPSGELEATFLPGVGMLGASLRHRGEELLGLTDNVAAYAGRGSTMGIPLLHPWANRLGGMAYEAAGVQVLIPHDQPRLRRDANGLPIHGLVWASDRWRATETAADADAATLRSTLDLGAMPELLAAFPFPHRLTVEARLDDQALTVAATLRATGDVPVPVSFGWHPYLVLPGLPREAWGLELPAMERLALDPLGLPTGAAEPFGPHAAPLADSTWDDGFAGLPDGSALALVGGGRRIELRLLGGYSCAQVYAPADRAVVALEPMTAPTNALATGERLRLVEPGASLAATFALAVAAS